ncbi:hypothetical protein BUALT_Bualt09G0051400 [Buddleja alternifolia]|uniref:Terpene cyclase/mutase family member n=1 Tax=Buddleja alternifolia TaxID=168488 RepID=A0AAV6X877_9LAMI|nr:hypothetical protein BUALT_Bualt09G0051400 [Buddleja alternifolia]
MSPTLMQLRKENPCGPLPEPIFVKENEEITKEGITTTLRRVITYFSTIQAHDGHWPAETAGPFFFLPPLVVALYISGAMNNVLSPEHHKEIKRYIYNHQNDDGGWGIHIEGHSTIFGSVLSYITLRLLGECPEDRAVTRGLKWILDHGGAIGIPSWGKFWLSVLGVYEWDGCNPMPPEFWLLPNFFPIHPGKMWCFCRLVYMPMSSLYGKRFVGPITGLVGTLREEIYIDPYTEINWNQTRNTCAKEDLYYPHPFVQDMLWGFLHHFVEPVLKRWPFSKLRDKALETAMEHIHYEDENSRYLCIGCVEKVLCLLACWVEDPNSEAYKRHLARIPDYLWVAEDGMKMQGSGSQTWEAALAVHAILSTNLDGEYGPTLRKAHKFLKASQVRDNPSGDFDKMYRHTSKGAWTFWSRDHGWQVSDCTSEALQAALLFSQMPSDLVGEPIETERLYEAVNVILSIQSGSGGFPAWEPQRAQRWLEKFNPTEFMEDIVIERDYVECTSSAIQSLVLFKKLHPGHRPKEIESCISRAIHYIENTQELDGSWYGGWGICYTYGTWFAVEGLVTYVQTSWALISLIVAGQVEIDPEPINRGIKLLINSQIEDGDFPQQNITGVFMKNCALNYMNYRNIFPIWALGEYRRRILQA